MPDARYSADTQPQRTGLHLRDPSAVWFSSTTDAEPVPDKRLGDAAVPQSSWNKQPRQRKTLLPTTPSKTVRSRSRALAASKVGTRIGAIDIGSNSIRQIVADVSRTGNITVLDELKAAPRLGAGVEATGMLSPEAMSSAIDALERMATLARRLRCDRIDAVATSAVREAANQAEFLARVRAATGLVVRPLSGEEEARLCFRSALAHFDFGARRTVVMDIGGGSLELVCSVDGIVEHIFSLPLGAVRLTERFADAGSGHVRIRALRRHVRELLREAFKAREWRGAQVIASGGTFTNLAGMHRASRGLLSARTIHGTRVPHADVERLLDLLAQMSTSERLGVPGLNRARADIIVAGLAVATEVLARIDARELLVSRYGIREGLLLEAVRVEPKVAEQGEARERSVISLAERCGYDEQHAKHVRMLALELIDCLGERLHCDAADRQILADAALLHDIGYHIGYDKHHLHSYHMIIHAELLGMVPRDQVLVANVARYHTGPSPKRKHPDFDALDKGMRRRVKRLAAILRLADGFDRGHFGAVRHLDVKWSTRALRVTPVAAKSASSLRLELWGASRKSGLLARQLGVPIEIIDPASQGYDRRSGDSSTSPGVMGNA